MPPDGFAKALMDDIVTAFKQDLQQQISAIRHPETGEFPTVSIEGDQLDDLQVRIECSPELLEIVQAQLQSENIENVQMTATNVAQPKAFLSYGTQDRALAGPIAHTFQQNGIDTWWAEWEIGPGDSIRRKIDAGLGQCTHFVVLLTPNSIDRPWVQEEMDAAFVRMVEGQCKFIPLRHNLSVSQLPSLMQGKLSPEVDAKATNLSELINFIHGISAKPPLGPAPAATSAPKTGYSPAASAIAEYLVRNSQHGHFADPQTDVKELAKATQLTEEDVEDAIHEIRHYVQTSWDSVYPKEVFFAEFDKFFMPWNPADDALRLAADLVNDPTFPHMPNDIALRYEWAARRLNPAIAFLQSRDLADVNSAIGTAPYMASRVLSTDATRRFVKSRS